MSTKKYGVCPVCNGELRCRATEREIKDGRAFGWYDYRESDQTRRCGNCGAQYQYGKPTGQVPLRSDGTPCQHQYTASEGQWRGTTNYTCRHCGDYYMVDGGG